ncbi:MAG TPA: translocation/assembly module TamB domain-containing protein [Bryobacteraceae bacterium]|nr:translocation/assembly module TamB domain-containing protein [Bryobacteraceae bacterium]
MRVLVRIFAAAVVLLAIAIAAAVVVLQSGWFHEYVRKRIVAELERATGGRVELGGFSFRVETLTARVAPLVLHGKEGPTEAPLLRADSVSLGLRIISVLERKIDLASLIVDKPRVHVAIYPDGSTNLPNPREPDVAAWAGALIDLAVRRYEVNDGVVEYDNRKTPLGVRGEGLQLRMRYDRKTPAYHADLNSRGVRVASGEFAAVDAALAAQFAVERSRVVVSRLSLSTRQSQMELSGELRDLRRPRGSFDVKAKAAVRDLVTTFSIPLQPVGTTEFKGRVNIDFTDRVRFTLSGFANARGLAYAKDRLKLQGVDLSADVTAAPDQVSLKNLKAAALGAGFTGSATLDHWSALRVDGAVKDLTVAQAAQLVTDRPMPWNGAMSGDISFASTLRKNDAKARVNLSVMPVSPEVAANGLTGSIHANYDQVTGNISFDPFVNLATGFTSLEASGTLNKAIQVRFKSMRLDDVLPALALLDPNSPKDLPLKLNNGTAEASGTVTGRLDNPQFQGQASVTNGVLEGHAFDKFTASLTASKSAIAASRFTLSRGTAEVTGNANVVARNESFDDASIGGQATARNVNLDELAREVGQPVLPAAAKVSGLASATVRFSGSAKAPGAEIALDVQKPSAFGEQLDRLRANLRIAPDALDVSGGEAEDGPGRLRFSGNYRRSGNDWKSGEAQIQIAAQNLPAKRVDALSRIAPHLDGRLSADIKGRLQIANGAVSLESADGNASAQAVTFDGQALGEATLAGATSGGVANVSGSGKVRDAAFQGQGSWKLQGDEPGSATLQFSRISVESVHQLAIMTGAAPQAAEELPFQGFVQGRATLSLPLRRPQAFQAEVTLDSVELDPKANQARRLGVQPGDIVLKNSGPVVVGVNSREARIASAKFNARDTSLEARGTIPFTGGGADISVNGSVNLIVLQLLNPNFLASGNAAVTATLQGSLTSPSLNGRLEIKDASLYLNDITTGADHANGVVRFDRNRAIVEKLTAQTGGGTATFGGFIEFGQALTYRLQAQAKQVRVRYPEDLSNTFDANLTLTGTSDTSTLAGTLTLNRTVFNPSTDLARLLAAASQAPSPANLAPSDYLRGMSFNIQIEGSPDFQFQTSLTRDVEAAVNMRLRGTPARPLLLGTIEVTEGEVQLFGNTYAIDRGEIRFQNPVRIEPILDMQLETKARGIVVTVSLTGTMQKLNVNYSSDPPLKQSEILALLVVGRAPSDVSAFGTTAATGSFAGATDLAQALSSQLSNRYQRFFGATRVKIDPYLTGIDTLPQARLTWEEQVSKDVTFTYITNLNRTQEQIMRVEWDFDKHWSAVALRDANGLFGIDFQYRKRLK